MHMRGAQRLHFMQAHSYSKLIAMARDDQRLPRGCMLRAGSHRAPHQLFIIDTFCSSVLAFARRYDLLIWPGASALRRDVRAQRSAQAGVAYDGAGVYVRIKCMIYHFHHVRYVKKLNKFNCFAKY
jgi:hypothetical protein